MELKYVWIKEYKMFNDFEVNLSHSGTDCFNYDGISLQVLEKEEPVLQFGNNISSITAIAGQNGSGKSSLFEMLIRSIATFSGGAMGFSYIIEGIVCIGDFIFCHSSLNLKNEKDLLSKGYQIHRYEKSPLERMPQKWKTAEDQVGFVYYSNVIDWRANYNEHNLSNISTLGYLIYKAEYGPAIVAYERLADTVANEPNRDYVSHIQALHIEDNYQYIKFLLDTDWYPISEPKNIIINLTYTGNNHFLEGRNPQGIASEIFNELLRENKVPNENSFIERETIISAQYKLYKLNLLKLILEDTPDHNAAHEFVYNDNTAVFPPDKQAEVRQILVRFVRLQEAANYPKKLYLSSIYWDRKGCLDWRFYILRPIDVVFTPEIKKRLKELITREEELFGYMPSYRCRINNYFLSDDLSSGEVSYYNLFSRLYSLLSENQHPNYDDPKDSLIIFVDEAETGFHPEWKRQFLSKLVEFFNKEFVNVKVQLVLSTHSPYFLSDLNTDNLILLKRTAEGRSSIVDQSKKKTFGANIHELLSESFFLEDGVVGEFAKGKIQELVDYLSDDNLKPKPHRTKLNMQSAQRLINIIGEPLVKDVLQAKYDEKFGTDKELEAKIIHLQTILKLRNR
tara:strand:- start:12682 stop:14550 length:1869 start_codon:yes stop_codon:yes gene_type:complete